MPELRKDPILDRWVIFSTERAKRPSDFKSERHESNSVNCPFCEGNEKATPPEIAAYGRNGGGPDTPGWTLRTVPNKFPALTVEGECRERSEGIFNSMAGVGHHEVIIESPRHGVNLPHLPEDRIADVFRCFRDRIKVMSGDKRIKYVLPFKNHGKSAGASLDHSHCQIISLPMVPKLVSDEMNGSEKYYAENNNCVYCDMIRQERDKDVRIVVENERFVVFCPYASRFVFESWVMPKEHQSHFEKISGEDLRCLASIMKVVLTRLESALSDPPYNFMIHTTPHVMPETKFYHWHIEIAPHLAKLAGFEYGTGYHVNPTPPEVAAQCLKGDATRL